MCTSPPSPVTDLSVAFELARRRYTTETEDDKVVNRALFGSDEDDEGGGTMAAQDIDSTGVINMPSLHVMAVPITTSETSFQS